MAEPRWSEDKGRVDGELSRLDKETREVKKRLSEEVGDLHERVNDVTREVGDMRTDLSTQIASIGTKLDLVHADVRNGQAQKGQTLSARISGRFMIIVALITALASLLVALLG